MAYRVTCPCGVQLHGRLEEDVVAATSAHVQSEHGRTYTPDEIMFMAMRIPDSWLPEEKP